MERAKSMFQKPLYNNNPGHCTTTEVIQSVYNANTGSSLESGGDPGPANHILHCTRKKSSQYPRYLKDKTDLLKSVEKLYSALCLVNKDLFT